MNFRRFFEQSLILFFWREISATIFFGSEMKWLLQIYHTVASTYCCEFTKWTFTGVDSIIVNSLCWAWPKCMTRTMGQVIAPESTLDKTRGIKETLPESQRTQGIESMTWIIFLTKINLKLYQLKKIIQVLNSIPWVRCASGNVFTKSGNRQVRVNLMEKVISMLNTY